MSLMISQLAGSKGGPRVLPKQGLQAARVVQVVDMGVQSRKPYKGAERPAKRSLWISFELVNDKADFKGDGTLEPHRISPQLMAFSTDPKSAIYKLLASIDPQGELKGDASKLVNRPVLVNVIYNKQNAPDGSEVTYANIGTVTPPMEGQTIPKLSTPGVVFLFDAPDLKVYNSLPKFIKEKLTTALNFSGSALDKLLKEGGDASTAAYEKPAETETATEGEDAPY